METNDQKIYFGDINIKQSNYHELITKAFLLQETKMIYLYLDINDCTIFLYIASQFAQRENLLKNSTGSGRTVQPIELTFYLLL